MSYDINILVLKCNNVKEIPFDTTIKVIDESQEVLRYKEIWSFMSQSDGMWYCLGLDENGWFETLNLIDADFDSHLGEKNKPYWINDEGIISNLKPITINSKYLTEFKKILEWLVSQSSVKTIMFMARYQGGEHEIINGVLSFDEFAIMLENGELMFNTCYIVSGK